MPFLIARTRGELWVGHNDRLTTRREAARPFRTRAEAARYLAAVAPSFFGAYEVMEVPPITPYSPTPGATP